LKRIAIILCLVVVTALVSVVSSPKIFAFSASSLKQHVKVCPIAHAGFARCNAILVVTGLNTPNGSSPSGYNPSDLQSAYSLPSSTAGSGQTVASVDAYNDPNAEADLGVYRSQFGLSACTTANSCFRKVNQSGGTTYPRGNRSWAQAISLDLDMVSAICPNCHILLVEATTNSFSILTAAVDEACAGSLAHPFLRKEWILRTDVPRSQHREMPAASFLSNCQR